MKRPISFSLWAVVSLLGFCPTPIIAFANNAQSTLATQQSQSVTITGKVQDTHGEPLVGVRIQEKGSTTGTITDIDGNFKLRISKLGAVIEVSYIGFTPQSITVNSVTPP